MVRAPLMAPGFRPGRAAHQSAGVEYRLPRGPAWRPGDCDGAQPAQPGGPGAGPRTVLTVAPAGGVKAKFDAAGRPSVSEVYPTEKAGLAAPRAKTWTRSG